MTAPTSPKPAEAAEHAHVYGRGANGLCRTCGHESNASRIRRVKRERRLAAEAAAPRKPFDLYEALCAKGGFDHEGNTQ